MPARTTSRSKGLNRRSKGLNRRSKGLNRRSKGLNRRSKGLNRRSKSRRVRRSVNKSVRRSKRRVKRSRRKNRSNLKGGWWWSRKKDQGDTGDTGDNDDTGDTGDTDDNDDTGVEVQNNAPDRVMERKPNWVEIKDKLDTWSTDPGIAREIIKHTCTGVVNEASIAALDYSDIK